MNGKHRSPRISALASAPLHLDLEELISVNQNGLNMFKKVQKLLIILLWSYLNCQIIMLLITLFFFFFFLLVWLLPWWVECGSELFKLHQGQSIFLAGNVRSITKLTRWSVCLFPWSLGLIVKTGKLLSSYHVRCFWGRNLCEWWSRMEDYSAMHVADLQHQFLSGETSF